MAGNLAKGITRMTYLERYIEATEGITYISSGTAVKGCSGCYQGHDFEEEESVTTEPYFSWSSCDTCNSTLGGNREDAHGYLNNDTLIHLSICTDCVVYLANGELPEGETK